MPRYNLTLDQQAALPARVSGRRRIEERPQQGKRPRVAHWYHSHIERGREQSAFHPCAGYDAADAMVPAAMLRAGDVIRFAAGEHTWREQLAQPCYVIVLPYQSSWDGSLAVLYLSDDRTVREPATMSRHAARARMCSTAYGTRVQKTQTFAWPIAM